MCRDDCLNAEDDRQVDDMETAVDLACSIRTCGSACYAAER